VNNPDGVGSFASRLPKCRLFPTLVLALLAIILLNPGCLIAYDSPSTSQLSIYTTCGFPSLKSNLMVTGMSTLQINLPLEKLSIKHALLRDRSLQVSAFFLHSLYRTLNYPSMEQFRLHLKTPLVERKAKATYVLGTSLTLDHLKGSAGFSLDVGAVLGYDLIGALRFYSPTTFFLYSDGLLIEWSLGVRPYIGPLRLGLNLGVTYRFMSDYSFYRTDSDRFWYLGIGYEF
jgi:hypothetical protein